MPLPCSARPTVTRAAWLLAALALLCAPAASQARSAGERPIPAFDGITLDGKNVAVSDFLGRRLLLVFFNPSMPVANPAARAAQRVSELSTSHNFGVLGIAVGSTRAAARDFVQRNQITYPVLDDATGRIAARLGLRQPAVLIGADAEGFMSFGTSSFDPNGTNEEQRVEDLLRTSLRLPERQPEEAVFGERPVAPLFETMRLAGGEPFRLADHAGRPVVLIFFLHTCPHCHHALEYLVPQIEKIPADKRPLLVALSVLDQPRAVRQMIAELKLDIPEVLLDPGRKVQKRFQLGGGVPVILFLDGDRRVVHRIEGWRDKRDPALARMNIAKIAGVKIPFLLNPKGYTGSDVCGVCHELELESWHYTTHANAFDTLVTHGASRNPECVGCHVVGFEQPGGYSIDAAPAHLEDVSCENCHGRGGPHLSKGFVKNGEYEAVCKTCHNATHSLGFEYASFRKNISHIQIAAMTPKEREALGGQRPGELMPSDVDYVGSAACQGCHPNEFATWEKSPHGHSLDSLAAKGKTNDADCLQCHTTAFDLAGGFPKAAAADPKSHADLARVGCESCHGPGGAHVGKDAKKRGTIISLGDKCDSCVILQICGGCHDEANDPGFAFEVEAKIERQRHGTIEAGTGKPISGAAALPSAATAPVRDELLAGRMLRELAP